LLTVSRSFMNVTKSVLWRMVIILKASKVNLFVSSVLFVFWYHSPNFLTHLIRHCIHKQWLIQIWKDNHTRVAIFLNLWELVWWFKLPILSFYIDTVWLFTVIRILTTIAHEVKFIHDFLACCVIPQSIKCTLIHSEPFFFLESSKHNLPHEPQASSLFCVLFFFNGGYGHVGCSACPDSENTI
jgi:hypothetical protein